MLCTKKLNWHILDGDRKLMPYPFRKCIHLQYIHMLFKEEKSSNFMVGFDILCVCVKENKHIDI